MRRRRQERLELGEAVALIEATKNIFREEKNMVELDAPVRPPYSTPGIWYQVQFLEGL